MNGNTIKTISAGMAVMMAMSGCTKRGAGYERIVSYMERKYDTDFEITDVQTGYGADGGHHVTLSSPEYPDSLVTVYANEQDGEFMDLRVSDNFPGIKYKEEITEALTKTLTSCYGENIRLFTDINCGSKEYEDGQKKFEELMARKGFGIRFEVWIVSDPFDREDVMTRLSDGFKRAGITASGKIYCVNGETEDIRFLSKEELKAIPSERVAFVMSGPGILEKAEWQD